MDVLAFDLGASSGKLYRGHFDGHRLSAELVHSFRNGAVELNGDLYWDILYIWRQLCEGISKASRTQPIDSFAMDSFSNDFALFDESGELLSPIRCYRDPRTLRCAQHIYGRIAPETLYQATGNQIAPFSTFMQLASMRAEKKDCALSHASSLMFLPDVINYWLTGKKRTEHTMATVSQLFDQRKDAWSDEVLCSFDIQKAWFPPIASPLTVIGRTRDSLSRSLGCKPFDVTAVCSHDTASAFLASKGENRIIISSGTWALVGCETSSLAISPLGFQYNIANEGGLPPCHRLIRNVMGSWIIQEIKAELQSRGEEYSYSQLVEMAAAAKPFQWFINVDDNAFYSPGGMIDKVKAKGKPFMGGMPDNIGSLIRCVCESLALKYRVAIDMLEAVTGSVFAEIQIVGGGAQDAFTCQLTASICERRVYAGPVEASALGNMLAQLLAHGQIASLEQGRNTISASFPVSLYEPEPNDACRYAWQAYREMFRL